MTKNGSGPTVAATTVKARKNELGGSSSENTKSDARVKLANKIARVLVKGAWRNVLPIHPAANKIPEATDAEKRRLAGDLDRHGQHMPVVLVRVAGGQPQLLDGRTRLDLLEGLANEVVDASGAVLVPCDIIDVADDAEAEAMSMSLNVHRRQIKPEEMRKLVAALIKAAPEKSDRQIAQTAKRSPTFVGKVRAKMEAAGEVSTVDTRTDAKGVKQPARKPPTKKKTTASPAKPKRSASQDRRELEARQAHIDELEAAREHDQGLAEKLRLAEMKIVGLESEVEELKAENAKLREQLEAAHKVAA
jgi:hypothetical protein